MLGVCPVHTNSPPTHHSLDKDREHEAGGHSPEHQAGLLAALVARGTGISRRHCPPLGSPQNDHTVSRASLSNKVIDFFFLTGVLYKATM